jgi:hypothetical protein
MMESEHTIKDEDLKQLQARVLSMRMDELFSEPYDPPEDLEELDN